MKQLKLMVADVKSCLCKTFTYAGRARRREYWSYQLFQLLILFLLCILLVPAGSILRSDVPLFFVFILLLGLVLCNIAVSVRRLHDVGLTGFWLVYLSPFGLPLVYVSSVLDVDPACNRVVERISHVGYAWLGWLLALLFWPYSIIVLFFTFLYAGKHEDNIFGPNPYID